MDNQPGLPQIRDFAEYLQAEAEDQALIAPASKTQVSLTSGSAQATPVGQAMVSTATGEDKDKKAQCRY